LFQAAGCPLPAVGPNIVNLRVLPPEQALKELLDTSTVVEGGTAMGTSNRNESFASDSEHADTSPGELQS
jgi:hypothetical protein